MTQLLFQTDSYLKEFDATVIEVNDGEKTVALGRTAFYPGGGGQPHDIGVIFAEDTAHLVIKVTSQEGKIWHWIDGALPATGAKIKGQIDWIRRYKLMRTHTALHVLCGVVWRDYGALVTGGNMEPLKGRMDFEFETLQKELVKEIEDKVNFEILTVNTLKREELQN